ncbi:hypothetical protein ACWGJ9_07315 [Curtobacterium citreum]
MTEIELTEPQRRLLERIADRGLRRRMHRDGLHHWIPDSSEIVRTASLRRLFADRLLRVVSLGVVDDIELSPAGRAYLQEHPNSGERRGKEHP